MGKRVLQLVLRRFPEFGPTFLLSIYRANSTINRAERKDLAHDDCLSTPSAVALPSSVTDESKREINFRQKGGKHGTPCEVDETDS